MSTPPYEWDPAKDALNREKHGLSFADFIGFDAEPMVVEDERRIYPERRFLAFGTINGKPHCIVYVRRGGYARLISFRRAHDKEMRRHVG